MAEISSQQGPDSNPITDSKLLLNHHHGNSQLPLITNGHPMVNGHHGVPATGQPTITNHHGNSNVHIEESHISGRIRPVWSLP